jgi:ribulose-phosphate 3-epimerase
MMVIPVINCLDVECVRKKIKIAKTFLKEGDVFHLDAADGSFGPYRTWSDPVEWTKLRSPFGIEVHLMTNRPEAYADDWFAAGARRLIVHAEALNAQSANELRSVAEHYHGEIMLSSKPGSTMEDIAPHLAEFGSFQVLAVEPGPAGQVFLPFIAEKIKFLREEFPDATIEVDGGMDPETVRIVKIAGADIIVSSSYIFDAADPKKAYELLEKV